MSFPSHLTPTETPRKRAKAILYLLLGVVLTVVAIGVFIIPVPLVVTTPGPTFDLKSTVDDIDIIHIGGTDPRTGEPLKVDNADSGDLRMVTISEYGGPGTFVTLFDVWRLTRDGVSSVEKYSDVYPPDVTADQVQSFSAAQMTSSHSTASVAALEELGWDVPARVTVNEVDEHADARGKILPGDVLVSVQTPDGAVHSLSKASTIFAVTAASKPETELLVTVERDGKNVPVKARTHASPDGVGSKLGIFLDVQTTLPVDVHFNLEHIGGPSAGMMFALAIIDKLTEGDLTDGQAIAGTGALSYDGRVQPIGGLAQKMAGARADGAQFFLAPSANCDELSAVEPGLRAFRVDTLAQARQAVQAIAAGDTSSLRACVAGR